MANQTDKGIVWVIGASGGLGLSAAVALAESGYRVIAGARSFDKGGVTEHNGMECLYVDVTSPASIDAFKQQALLLSPRVDALINAAGILVLGSCEETSRDEYDQVIKTNFLGAVTVVQAVMPIMRAQGNGKIINFSSILGLIGIPFQSAYTASKHALEGYSECLAMEAAPFGIQVCLVEPGDHQGGAARYRQKAAAVNTDSPYYSAFLKATAAMHHDEQTGSLPGVFGKAVVRLMAKKRLPMRYRIASFDQHLAVILHKVLPGRLMHAILTQYYLGKGDAVQHEKYKSN